MRRSFSPHFDRMVRRAIRSGDIGDIARVKRGRRIELTVMGLVQFPERIQRAWEAGQYDDLAYLAEYLRAGIPRDLEHTDRVLYAHLKAGFATIRRMGWAKDLRHQPGPLRIRAAAERRRVAAENIVS